ncbi:adenylosuccinate synthase [soil metagenome]
MPATIILGGQWGDEGKGKITDALAVNGGMVVRANGGSNAGHTIETGAGVFKMHLVPSGILNPECTCVIGAGVVIDPFALANELDALRERGIDTSNLVISERAHVVLPFHSEIDRREEVLRGDRSIGTTLRGIGPAYADKVSRRGLRMVDLTNRAVLEERVSHQLAVHGAVYGGGDSSQQFDRDGMLRSLAEIGERLGSFIGPAEIRVQDALDAGEQVLVECAQGVMLDIDYGTYPFVTSSSPSAAGACQGAGVAPGQVERVIGVFKAYSTRVGAGPMPTELRDETGELIRERGLEYGTTTGRPRRTGWFDAVAARNAVRLNGVSEIALTLVDVFDVFPEISVCSGYQAGPGMLDYVPADLGVLVRVVPIYEAFPGWMEDITSARNASDLPDGARSYGSSITERIGAPVTMMGVGPAREQLVMLG